MKKISFLSALLFTILIMDTGCKKEEPWPPDGHTIAQGRILEYGTGKPIAGAMVKMILYEGTIFGGGFSFPIDTVFTDENGYYYFEVSKTGDLSVIAEADQYYPSKGVGLYIYKDNMIDLIVDPYAWLKLHVKNVTPIGEYDFIRAHTSIRAGESANEHYGPGVDLTILQSGNRGNRNLQIGWVVVKDGIQNNYQDTIYLPAHDTTFYEILY